MSNNVHDMCERWIGEPNNCQTFLRARPTKDLYRIAKLYYNDFINVM